MYLCILIVMLNYFILPSACIFIRQYSPLN
uniref:Uncharacterized protein n=1 Tax=Anguilla anguilla TaxID=7936 RepID=A0A0E9V991_ANGAN